MSINDVIAKFVGLKMCLPSMRMKNLPAMAMSAARRSHAIELLRRSSDSDNAEIAALFHSKLVSQIREQMSCVTSAATKIIVARATVTSKRKTATP